MEDNDNAGGEQVFIIMPVFAPAKDLILLVFTLSFAEQHLCANKVFTDSYPSDWRETGHKMQYKLNTSLRYEAQRAACLLSASLSPSWKRSWWGMGPVPTATCFLLSRWMALHRPCRQDSPATNTLLLVWTVEWKKICKLWLPRNRSSSKHQVTWLRMDCAFGSSFENQVHPVKGSSVKCWVYEAHRQNLHNQQSYKHCCGKVKLINFCPFTIE